MSNDEGVGGWLINTWAERFAQTLEAMTGERPPVSWKPSALPPPADLLWWEQPFTVAAEARLWAGAPEESWREIGFHVLRAAGLEEAEPADARSTYLEIAGQSCSALARDLGARLGREVSCENGSEGAPPPSGLALFSVDLALASGPLPSLHAGLSPALAGCLQEDGTAPTDGPLALPPVQKPNPKTLDLLMEVELPVSISFGRAQLPLKDVLKLATGSIVELNRGISEPVEVIVNNCVIARGEVVVVDGNYGVRIHEIISRQERLRTLK